MATTTFATALLIFTNLWLFALISFGIVASSLFLYILGPVGVIIGPSLVVSLISSACSSIYLTLQCINVRHTTHRRWHRSWLNSACVHLPRVLIVLWIITTTLGLLIVFRQPLCRNGKIGQDAAAWQAGIGCWIFKVVVSLDTVMLILSFTLFCLLEVNGRYVSLALFHFEYTPASTSVHHRRRCLIASPYGAIMETFPSTMTITSEDEIRLMHEKHNNQSRSLSPSPTYHTFDSAKTSTMVWPGSGSTSGKLTRDGSRDDFLCDLPIPIDLTLHGSLPVRRSMTFAASLPKNDMTNANTSTIFSSAQLKSRPISNIPDVPSKVRNSFLDLQNITAPLVTAPIAAKPISDQRAFTHTAPHNFGFYMVNPTTRFRSTCALPFESATRAHSTVDLSSYSIIAPGSDDNVGSSTNFTTLISKSTNTSTNNDNTHRPSSDTTSRLSTSSLPEHPPPAWCPQTLKSAPLSADPAIRRLTEVQSRTRCSMIRKSRTGTAKIRESFGAFEFGFGASGRRSAMSTSDTSALSPIRDRDAVDSMSLDLSEFPATPTPLARKRAEDGHKKEREKNSNISNGATNKENCVAAATSITTDFKSSSTSATAPALKPTNPTNPKKDKIIGRSRGRATSTSTSASTKGSYSIMPPATGRQRGGSSASGSALGLGIEGINVPSIVVTPDGKGERLDERATKKARQKKIVERGRWEKMPR